MNFRNRYLVIAVRVLLGLVMLASGISGLLMGNSTKGVPPQMVTFTHVFWASGIFQMVKVTEIVAGFMLLFGILPALAALFLAPDVVGIVVAKRPVDAFIPVDWCNCFCADRLSRVRLLGQIRVNLRPQL
jgi:uncharacterized membrane protein YphA (DoxX/SURF4 family)